MRFKREIHAKKRRFNLKIAFLMGFLILILFFWQNFFQFFKKSANFLSKKKIYYKMGAIKRKRGFFMSHFFE